MYGTCGLVINTIIWMNDSNGLKIGYALQWHHNGFLNWPSRSTGQMHKGKSLLFPLLFYVVKNWEGAKVSHIYPSLSCPSTDQRHFEASKQSVNSNKWPLLVQVYPRVSGHYISFLISQFLVPAPFIEKTGELHHHRSIKFQGTLSGFASCERSVLTLKHFRFKF